jgi:hypothetical protein
MSHRPAATTAIIVSDLLAGVLVTENRRFRFVAVDGRFGVLDGSRFPDADAARQSAARLADATADRETPERDGCSLRGPGRRQACSALPRWIFSS